MSRVTKPIVIGNGDVGIVNISGKVEGFEGGVFGIGFHKLANPIPVGQFPREEDVPKDVRDLDFTIVSTSIESLYALKKAVERAIKDFEDVSREV